MVGSPAVIAASWPELEHALADAGYAMRRHKCKAWAPGRKAGLSIGAEMRLGLLTQLILESQDSLPLLGAAAEGKWSTVLGPFSAAAAPAMERAQKAEAVCAALRRYVVAQPDEFSKQAAHAILQKSVAMALCYDVRVNQQWAAEYAVDRLQAAVLQTAAEIYEVTGPLLRERAQLPGSMAGGRSAAAARRSLLQYTGPRGRHTLGSSRISWPSSAGRSRATPNRASQWLPQLSCKFLASRWETVAQRSHPNLRCSTSPGPRRRTRLWAKSSTWATPHPWWTTPPTRMKVTTPTFGRR